MLGVYLQGGRASSPDLRGFGWFFRFCWVLAGARIKLASDRAGLKFKSPSQVEGYQEEKTV